MDTSRDTIPKLDAREEHYRIPSPHEGLRLFLRRLFPRRLAGAPGSEAARRPVLYVHGATFPSALSIAHRLDGRSWRDALCDAGFDVWGLDFQGFGGSDPYPEMDQPADANGPLCLAEDAETQLAAAVRFILEHQGVTSLSLLAHSWGSMVAGRFAGAHPTLVDRLALFAPIARRDGPRYARRPDGPAWRVITAEDQRARFVEDVPAHEAPVLAGAHFEDWAARYLDSDPESRSREPAGVKVPSGPFVEILRAWHGELAFDPGLIRAPTAILRGAWDGLVTDADARWLFDALAHSPVKRDVKIGRGTHLMHLEAMRPALWRESASFLLGDDVAPIPLQFKTHEQKPGGAMFSVIFEVHPKSDQWDAYLGYAKMLRPELVQVDGFIDNVRYGSKRHEGWVLSLSTWRDEKALMRWRTLAVHHEVQKRGRSEVFRDYHLRVGQITADNRVPEGQVLREQRLDETETGASKAVSIVEMKRPADLPEGASIEAVACRLGLPTGADVLVDWDVFDAILTPGDLLLLLSWRDAAAADAGERAAAIPAEARLRRVRIVRDYGMFERHETPQYYPDVKRPAVTNAA